MKSILTICLILFALTTQAQPYWSGVFKDPHKKFDQGKFKSALKKYKKTTKHIEKAHGGMPLLTLGWMPIDEARTHEAMGHFPTMERLLDQGVSKLEARRESNPEAYAQGVMWAATVYLRYGNYARAAELLAPFEEAMMKQDMPDYLANEMRFHYARACMYRGDFQKAQTLGDELVGMYRPLIEQPGLPEEEKRHRAEIMVRILLLEAELLSQQGYYRDAKLKLAALEPQITRLVPKNSEVFGEYLMLIGDNLMALNDFKEADRFYRRAAREAKNARLMPKILERDARNQFARDREGQARAAAKDLRDFGKKVKSKENSYLAQSQVLEAQFEYEKRDFKKAEKLLNEVRTSSRAVLPREHPTRLAENDVLTQVMLAQREWRKAKYAIDFATDIHEKLYGADCPAHTFRRLQKAHFYLLYTPEVEQAKAELEKIAIDSLLKNYAPAHPIHYQTLQILADFARDEENYTEAIKYQQQAIEILRKKYGSGTVPVSRQEVRLVELYTITGKYAQADSLIAPAVERIRAYYGSSAPEYLDASQSYATLLGWLGRYDEAEKLLRREQRKTESAQAVENLASLYAYMGEYAKTEELLRDVIRQKTSLYGAQSRLLIRPYYELGKLAITTGDYEEAARHLNRAAHLARETRGEQSLQYADIQLAMADVHKALGSYAKAKEEAEFALKRYQEKLDTGHIKIAHALTALALIQLYESEATNEEVEELLRGARQVIKSTFGQNHPLYAEALRNLALFEISRRQYDQAILMLNHANTIWTDYFGEKNKDVGEALMLLGNAYSGKRQFRKARDHYQEAEQILGRLFDERHPTYVKTLTKMAQMYYISKDYKRANELMEQATAVHFDFIRTYFPALSEGEKEKFWNMIRTDFEFFNSLAISRAAERPDFLGKMYDYSLATKGILLSTSAKIKRSILQGKNTELKRIYRSWVSEKEKLKTLLTLSAEERSTQQGLISSTQKNIESLEKALSRSGGRNLLTRFYSWEEIRKSLADNEAAIEIIRYRHFGEGFTDSVHYAALILTSETKRDPQWVLLPNGKSLETKQFKYYRNMMIYELADQQSYQEFWQPIEEALDPGITRIYFCPDGVYNQINISSLRQGEDRFILDEKEIITVTNGSEIVRFKEQQEAGDESYQAKKGTEVLLIGAPKFYKSEDTEKVALQEGRSGEVAYISPLPGTEREVTRIAALFEEEKLTARVLTGEAASEKALADFQLGKSPRIFHMATHGFFGELSETQQAALSGSDALGGYNTPSPLLRSGLLLEGAGDLLLNSPSGITTGDGVMTAYEVMTMNFNDTELAVLSACETGRGEVQNGEGVFGLQRAFLVAGADALILSLFKVSDAVTQELMVAFYRNWLTKGMNKRAAFLKAQRDIRKIYTEPILFIGVHLL